MEILRVSARRERRRSRALLAGLVLMIFGVPAVAGRSVATAAVHRSHHAVSPIILSGSRDSAHKPLLHASSTGTPLAMSSQFRVGLTFSVGLVILGGIAIFVVARRRN